MTTVGTGAAMILPAPAFDPLATMRAIQDERATSIYGVPTMFIAQLQHPEFSKFDFSSLRTGVMAGAPCPIEIMKRVVDDMHCPQMTIMYGQTESSPVITMADVDDSLERRVSTVGCPCGGTEVKVVFPDGDTAPVGEQGELCTRGYLVMKGYDQEPEATARAVDRDGWLHTGDIATIDADGYVTIVDRKKEIIINAAGKNMSPANIEAAVKSGSPLIGQACCIGDGRPYNTALIVLDADFAPQWAAREGLGERRLEELAQEPAMVAAIQVGIDEANRHLARVEQIKTFRIVPGDWVAGGEELTPTMKLRRKPIAHKYAEAIEQLYGGG
jgi:long-subunit acyl-CoA synthetase (AMP-forming)